MSEPRVNDPVRVNGPRVNELARLLRYSRPYAPHLSLSILLMACVGAAQGLTVLLIGPILDRVLKPGSADEPVKLYTIPIWNHTIYLQDLMPSGIHNVFNMVA